MKEKLNLLVASPESSPEGGAFFSHLLASHFNDGTLSISVNAVPWERFWNVVHTEALYRTGVDISEVGSTWLGSLVDAKALRPFSNQEIEQLGGATTFSENAWKGVHLENANHVLSIPWLTDVRVIYYWRDMLSSAGVKETEAFASPEQLNQTLETLHKAGVPAWGTPSGLCMNTVHHMASWIWAGGKDFISKDGRRVEFYDDEAIRGIEGYFKLYRFMPRRIESLTELRQRFRQKQVAVVMDGPWMRRYLLGNSKNSDTASQLGISLPPGSPFLGGSQLVVWNTIDEEWVENALKLLKYLVSGEVQTRVILSTGHLPVRRDLLNRDEFLSDPHYRVLLKAEEAGRRLPYNSIWGQLENSLSNACYSIWQKIPNRSDTEITDVIKKQLEPIARRFDRLLNLF